ncbi:hypothetical protein RhiirA5_348161, partial [Rhizophagus irregularis]
MMVVRRCESGLGDIEEFSSSAFGDAPQDEPLTCEVAEIPIFKVPEITLRQATGTSSAAEPEIPIASTSETSRTDEPAKLLNLQLNLPKLPSERLRNLSLWLRRSSPIPSHHKEKK